MAMEADFHDVTFSAETARSVVSKRGTVDFDNVFSLLVLILLLGAWELSVHVGLMPAFLLPAPSKLVIQFLTDLSSAGFWKDVVYTVSEILLGFAAGAVAGVGLGAAIALVPVIEKIVWPYIITLQTIPKVAIAPLLIIWFGFGIESKVLIVALICFFPILVNAVAGFKGTDSRQLLLMESMDSTKWQVFKMVRFPNAVPFLIAGFRIAIVLSVIGAVIGEFLGATSGLGALIVIRQSNMDVTGVFSVLAMLSIIGLSMNVALGQLSRRLAFWADTGVEL